MTAIRGIVFDKDGVLVDFQKTYAPATLEVINKLAESDAGLIEALSGAVSFDHRSVVFHPSSLVIAGTAADIAIAWHPYLPDWSPDALTLEVGRLYDDLTVRHVTAFGDVSMALTALREAGFHLALATNDTQESAHRHLTAIGEKQFFDFIAGYDSGHGAKPGPGMILAFAEHLRCSPQELIMVGDSTHDMESASAAGAIRVAVTTGLATVEDLAPHADHVIGSLSELLPLARKISAS